MPHLKTLTYAVMHLVVAVGVAFALTQNWTIALGIGRDRAAGTDGVLCGS